MNDGPFVARVLFFLGPVSITTPVVTTWGLMLVLAAGCMLATRRLTMRPGALQTALELLVCGIADQIRGTIRAEPARFLPLIGTVFIFLATANLLHVLPGLEPPTAHIETAAALAAVVFVATHWYGVRTLGLRRYLAGFAKPVWIMLPLNVISEFTRTFSLMIRLFGNIMSAAFIGALVLSLAGLFVPIPFMALDILTGLVQAYIFAILATVFIGAAIGSTERA